MLLLRLDTCLTSESSGSGRGLYKGEEDTALDIKVRGILVGEATDTTLGVSTFSKKRQHVLTP